MLTKDVLSQLDARLLKLSKALDSSPNFSEIAEDIRKLLKYFERPKKIRSTEGRYLLSPQWETAWIQRKEVATGLFRDPKTDETDKSLHCVFQELVRFVLDSKWPEQEEDNTSSLKKALHVYLRERGHNFPKRAGSNSLPEQHVGLSQMAGIVNRSPRTLARLYESGVLPVPDVEGGEGMPNEWKWLKVVPILRKRYKRPDLPDVFPADRFIRR